MTDLPNDSAADAAANASTPAGDTPAGDPELAALVGRDTETPVGDPELAALVSPAAGRTTPAAGAETADPAAAAADSTSADPDATQVEATIADAPASDALTDPTTVDTLPTFEAGVDAVPVLPLAAIVSDGGPSVRPRRRRSLALRFGFAFVLGFLLTVGVGAGVLYAWDQQYAGRVLPGVSIGSTELGGLTREEAEAAIATDFGWLGDGQITLNGPGGQTTTIEYADVGRGPDTAALLDAALAAGRQGEPLANLIRVPQVALHGMTLDSAVTYDRDKLATAVASLATTIDQSPTNALVTSGQGGSFNVSSAKDGRAVDQRALLTALDQQLAALGTPASITTTVPVVTLAPVVATSSAEAAKAAADRMAADLVVSRGEHTWTIAGTKLAPLVSFLTAGDGTITPVLDEAGLDPILKTLAKQVKQQVRDAGLKLKNGRVVVTHASREGRTLKADGMKTALISEIGARQAGSAASTVKAVVKAVNPKLTTADAKAFAPKMKVISKYSVFYWVIVNNHWGGNIEGPATVINGTVVPPGGKFDFWKVIGDLRDAPGTGPGNAIEGGKITVTGAFGGGICTTSTTLFNAAFRAGMIPLSRQNHNEYITRYPAGLDATVWIVGKTKQTMSFKNDTKYPILIQRVITNSGGKRWITFKIWSVPNHRTYKISNVVIKHGPRAKSTIVRDPSKPVGYRFFNNAPADGAKVGVTVSIYDHGKLHWRKRYFSNYPAVDGVTVIGTKKS